MLVMQLDDADSEDEDESDEEDEETPVKKVMQQFYYRILLSLVIIL